MCAMDQPKCGCSFRFSVLRLLSNGRPISRSFARTARRMNSLALVASNAAASASADVMPAGILTRTSSGRAVRVWRMKDKLQFNTTYYTTKWIRSQEKLGFPQPGGGAAAALAWLILGHPGAP